LCGVPVRSVDEEIFIAGGSVGDEGVFVLKLYLQKRQNCWLLTFSGDQELRAAIRPRISATMTEADFSDRGLGLTGAAVLGVCLQFCKKLSSLNISDNDLGAEGAQHVLAALQTNHTLSILNISRNQLKATGAENIARILQANQLLWKFTFTLDWRTVPKSVTFDDTVPDAKFSSVFSEGDKGIVPTMKANGGNGAFVGSLSAALTKKTAEKEGTGDASKEQTAERQLREITKTWDLYEITFLTDDDNSDVLLNTADATAAIERAGEQQIELNLIIGAERPLQKEQALLLKSCVTCIEDVLSAWKLVQQKLLSLRPVFRSTTIAAQLSSSDIADFRALDSDYAQLIQNAVQSPKAQQWCSVSGHGQELDLLDRRLDLCQ
jgi:hypothetical protein